jgi:hypothetical protein
MLRAAIHRRVGHSRRTNAFNTCQCPFTPALELNLPQKGYTLAASSVSASRRFPGMTGFRIRVTGLVGTLVALAAVVGTSKSF